jgi:curved DNA-binding protein CbpA
LSREVVPAPDFLETLRGLRIRRATGVLEIQVAGQKRRLFLREGEVHLPGAHPLAQLLAERLERLGGTGPPTPAAAGPLLEIVERIAEVVADWRASESEFREGLGVLPPDLTGPLPSARLLMLAATAGQDDAAVEKRAAELGPRYASSPAASSLADRLGFQPEEDFLLERLRHPMALPELLANCPIPRAVAVRRLVQLVALGAVLPEATAERSRGADSAELVQRIAERIARSLEDRPLELGPDEYRQRIGDLLARHGGLDHYELLEIPPSASVEQIQAAYEDLARLVHPVNAEPLGLGGRQPALRLLFERATDAYEVLSDPERRRTYNQRQMIEIPSAGPSGAHRDAEKRSVARGQYERALMYANAGDVHNAIQLLEQVVKTDPKLEYWCALGRLQARNPSWLRRALESYRNALQIDSQNADVRFAIGQLFEQLGEPERARVQYGAAVRYNPNHTEAAERLARLHEARDLASRQEGGLLSRFFRRE